MLHLYMGGWENICCPSVDIKEIVDVPGSILVKQQLGGQKMECPVFVDNSILDVRISEDKIRMTYCEAWKKNVQVSVLPHMEA